MGDPGGDTNGSGTRDALHTLCLSDPVWAERYLGWTELGRGASAAVVRTFNRDSGGDVALKIFYGLAAEDRVRFEREVRGAQCLASQFIVRTFSAFERGSLAWIEMELVDGLDLRQELAQRAAGARAFAHAEACGIAACVAEALVAAHAADVIHRDVKPANVLLPRLGSPAAKLSDFGISRILGATRVTATGLLTGTPQFAAPEVAQGAEVGPAVDVYSLALCLYLMLSGNRFPYDLSEGATVAQWLRAHSEGEPRPIRALDPSVPVALAEVIMAGLAKDPRRRPTAAELLSSLRPWTGGAAAPRPNETRAASRVRLRLAGYAAALLFGLAAGIWLAPARTAPGGNARDSPLASPTPATSAEVPLPIAAPTAVARATPATTHALTTPSPRPVAAARAQALRVSFQGGVLRIANASSADVTDLRVTLHGADGTSHLARLPEALTAGDEVFLAADSFTPPFGAGFAAVRAEIATEGGTAGGRVYPVVLNGQER
jgi:eukaryotic-like serine/threonine-protein kinase